ncbi:Cell wall protein IFF4 [Nakaseomyces glabratus]|nr:Cell wall protein IFF4 [Nakaseomyces glabratus]
MKKKLTLSKLKLMLMAIFSISINVSAQTVIGNDTIVYGNNPSGYENGYVILGGAYLAFQDTNSVPMYQIVRVDKGGALYYVNNDERGFSISSGHAYTVPFEFRNEGTVVVDDRQSSSPGSWTVNDGTFTNTGRMMFTSRFGDTIGIYSNPITNTGFLYSKGIDADHPQKLEISNGNNWINTGTVCLANTTFLLQNTIQGGGCISIGENSLFNIYNFDIRQQTIYLSDSSSVVALSNGQTVTVYGLGNGNGFLYPHFPIKKVTYDSLSGVATFSTGLAGLQKFTVFIGVGYNESNFEIVRSIKIQDVNYNNYNFVRYTGPPPNLAPSVCQPCVEIPLYSFQVPDPYTTTNELGFSETVSFYSTYNKNDIPVIGNTTIYVPPAVYTLTKVNESTTETEIISRVTGIGYNGLPFTYYTTMTVGEMETGVITETITITENNSRSTKTTLMSRNYTFSFSNYSPISSSGRYSVSTVDKTTTLIDTVANVSSSGPNSIVTATMSTYQNNYEFNNASAINVTNSSNIMVPITSTFYNSVDSNLTTPITSLTRTSHNQIVSHITKLASSINQTTIVTTFPAPAASGADYTTVVTNADGSVETDIVSHITTTDSDGKPTTITDIVSHITTTDSDGNPTTIVTTVPCTVCSSNADYTTVVTKSNGSVETEVVSHITITDAAGKPTTIVTTVPCTVCSSNADYTTVVTKSNGSVETEVVSHITTTDSNGQTITITTTAPCTEHNGNEDYTAVVTKSNGSVETEVVSHITTTDSNGKPTTIVTTVPCTVCSSNADYTTVVTKSNGSVETEVVSHITTTDSNGKPTTITTTAPCSNSESHVESQTTSPSMHTTSLVGSENGVSAKTVNDKPNPTSVTEVALSQGTTSNAGYSTDQGSSLEMFAPTGASAVESGNKVSQTQTASIFHGAGSTFKIKFNTILLSTSLTILILLGMA